MESQKEHILVPGFFAQVFTVDGIRPNALENLENFVSNVELVIELGVSAGAFGFNVELHQRMEQVLMRKRRPVQHIPKHTLCIIAKRPDSVEKYRHQACLEVRTLNVLGVAQEGYADGDELFTLCCGDDVREVAGDELEIGHNAFQKVLRQALEDVWWLARKREQEFFLGDVLSRC